MMYIAVVLFWALILYAVNAAFFNLPIPHLIAGFVIWAIFIWFGDRIGAVRENQLENLREEFESETNSFLNNKSNQTKIIAAYRKLVSTDAFGAKNYDRFEKELVKFITKGSISFKKMQAEGYTYEFQFNSLIKTTEKLIQEADASLNFSSDMSPYEYEIFCAERLKDLGWNAEATQSTSDQGVDVVATKGSLKLVAQCKLFSKAVGNSAVQEIVAGKNYYKANIAIVIAPNGFTGSAIKLAAANNVKLLHHSELDSAL